MPHPSYPGTFVGQQYVEPTLQSKGWRYRSENKVTKKVKFGFRRIEVVENVVLWVWNGKVWLSKKQWEIESKPRQDKVDPLAYYFKMNNKGR